MTRWLAGAARCLFVLAAVLCEVARAWAQAATEVHIPIGRSPGVSGKTSVIGTVERLEPLTVAGRTFHVDEDQTRVYLDRNAVRQPNRSGTLDDLAVGQRVEVKPRPENARVADWIKIDAR